MARESEKLFSLSAHGLAKHFHNFFSAWKLKSEKKSQEQVESFHSITTTIGEETFRLFHRCCFHSRYHHFPSARHRKNVFSEFSDELIFKLHRPDIRGRETTKRGIIGN
jgi:hypothetical protein